MSLIRGLRARLRALLRPGEIERELEEEIRFHLAREIEKNIEDGMEPAEARRAAFIRFGGTERARDEHRDGRRIGWFADLVADTRFAARSIRRAPGLSGAAVLTLALGIGANVAIFSAVRAVILRPLPFPEADRLIVIEEYDRETGRQDGATPADYFDWRAGVPGFEDAMAHIGGYAPLPLTGRGDLRLLNTQRVSGNFFSVLGVPPARGRTLREEETWARSGHVAVLSDDAWREYFDADESVVGATVMLDGTAVQIVGVMPPGFDYPHEDVDVWRSLAFTEEFQASSGFQQAHYLTVVARLESGVTYEQARAQLDVISARLARDRPAFNRYTVATMRTLEQSLSGSARLPLLILLTSVALLLLIACANVGNLLLVQATGRQRETALRLALGAGRRRLVRQALAESLVLSIAGGTCGLAIGWAGAQLLVALQPERMLPVRTFGVDAVVLGYVAGITLTSALLFGIAPALWMHRRDPAESLRGGGRAIAGGHPTRRWADVLVVVEVAIALIMTVGAGLLVRSVWHLQAVDPGFDARGVLAVQYQLNSRYDTDAGMRAFTARLLDRARHLPRVTDAAITGVVSLSGGSGWTTDYIAAGRTADRYGTGAMHRLVSPSYFTTMKVPLLRGRTFDGTETPLTPYVVIINDVLARAYFPGQDPIGQRIAFERAPTAETNWYTIIGVAGAERTRGLDVAPIPEVYESILQTPQRNGSLLLRTEGDPAGLAPAARELLRDLDPLNPVYSTRTMELVRARSMARTVFLTALLLMFASVGVGLALIGVYGVLAHNARSRTRELGIRIALGAEPSTLRWLVIRDGLRLMAAGIAAGGVAALAATRSLRTLLFNVAPHDPLTLAGVAMLLVATGVLASWLPARRASLADPMVTLRAD